MEGEHDAIWAEIPEGGLLKDLFGYWPTLHDARIRTIQFDPSADEVRMLLHYRDLPTDAEKHLSIEIEMVWQGVRSADLRVEETTLMGIHFKREHGLIRTDFEQGFGVWGHVVAEFVEATLRRLDPIIEDAENSLRVLYSTRA